MVQPDGFQPHRPRFGDEYAGEFARGVWHQQVIAGRVRKSQVAVNTYGVRVGLRKRHVAEHPAQKSVVFGRAGVQKYGRRDRGRIRRAGFVPQKFNRKDFFAHLVRCIRRRKAELSVRHDRAGRVVAESQHGLRPVGGDDFRLRKKRRMVVDGQVFHHHVVRMIDHERQNPSVENQVRAAAVDHNAALPGQPERDGLVAAVVVGNEVGGNRRAVREEVQRSSAEQQCAAVRQIAHGRRNRRGGIAVLNQMGVGFDRKNHVGFLLAKWGWVDYSTGARRKQGRNVAGSRLAGKRKNRRTFVRRFFLVIHRGFEPRTP